VVELHIPGSPAAATALRDQLVQAGARRAQAGEFTARAFFSGRLDLSAAQAVADIIDAADDSQLRLAMVTLGGRVAKLCAAAAGKLADVLATTEASIDLAEEQIELDSPTALSARLTELAAELEKLATQAAQMPEQAHRPHVVLCGLPNAGKSSLLNELAGVDRAIVSPVAGTTRDVLSTEIFLSGSGVVLQDAAGLGNVDDPFAQAASGAARAAIAAADVLLLVVDVSQGQDLAAVTALAKSIAAMNPRAPMVLLANKIDLLNENEATLAMHALAEKTGSPALGTSAVTGQGLQEFRQELANRLQLNAFRGGDSLGLHQWQRQCFVQAARAAHRAGTLLSGSAQVADQAELVAIELREALAQLGQISGQIVNEDILGRIFARFCVGK
jgi:tRNA modification GTPase